MEWGKAGCDWRAELDLRGALAGLAQELSDSRPAPGCAACFPDAEAAV